MSVVKQGRHWLLTLQDAERKRTVESIIGQISSITDTQYIFQLESGGETHNLHWQIYLGTPRLRFKKLKKVFPTAHIESCRSAINAKRYCVKISTRVDGPWSNLSDYELKSILEESKTKSSLKDLKDQLDKGAKLKEVAQSSFPLFLRYQRGIEAYQNLLIKQRNWKTIVMYLWGRPGTGKSRLASAIGKSLSSSQRTDTEQSETTSQAWDSDIYYKTKGQWWDMYDQEEIVIWDDFRGSSYELQELLKLCDRYPYKIQKKGSITTFTSKIIIFTSNMMSTELYKEGEPFQRRIEFNWNILDFDGINCKFIDVEKDENIYCLDTIVHDLKDTMLG